MQKFGGTSVGKFAANIAEDIVACVVDLYVCFLLLKALAREYIDQHKVAIVCSARSGSTKALGTTNLLLRAAKEALQRTSSPSETPGHMTPALFTRVSQTQSPVDSPRARSSSSPRLDPMSPGGALSMSSTSTRAPAFNETVDLIRSEHFAAARSSIHNRAILRELEMEIERDCDSLRSFLFATQVIDEISPRSRDTIIGFGERLACKVMTAILRDRVCTLHHSVSTRIDK